MIKTSKKTKYIILLLLIVMVITSALMLNVNKSYAGSWVIGDLNYYGSINSCEYSIIASATIANEHRYSASGFQIQMNGVSCKRNIWTTFTYKFTFILSKDSVVIAMKPVNFKISAATDINKAENNPIIFIENVLKGSGKYLVTWTGAIHSNVNDEKSGNYTFYIM